MKKAFTLIELLVVISIIGLLSSVVLASLNSAREKGRIGGARYFAAQVDHVAGDSTVGSWDFNEAPGLPALDLSGFSNSATLQNGATRSADTPSGSGYSVYFDGSGDYVQFAQPLTSGSPFTISFWFKPEHVNSSYDIVYSGTDNIDVQLFFFASTKKFTTSIENVEIQSNFALTDSTINKWHHFVVTYDYSRRKVYIDGVLDTDSADSTTLTVNDANVRLGQTLGGGYALLGKLDDLRIFSKTLTAGAVGDMYAEGLRNRILADSGIE